MEAQVIALIFDYDDTLVPDSTTQLLKEFGINHKDFWDSEFKRLVSQKYDPPLAYLKLLLDKIGTGKPLGQLSNYDLRKFGSKVEKTLYPGVKSLIKDLNKTVETYSKKGLSIQIEYYVISGGLEEIIKGNKFITDNFTAIYGCRLGNNSEDDSAPLSNIKRTISFTEKTRYLFEIIKGITIEESNVDPSAVNKHVEDKDKKVKFENMIYVGDGLTDIPCFSLIEKGRGTPFAVYHHKKSISERLRVYEQIIKARRSCNSAPPNYNKNQVMGSNIRMEVERICLSFLKNRMKAI